MKKWMAFAILTAAIIVSTGFLTGGTSPSLNIQVQAETNEITVTFNAGVSGRVEGDSAVSLQMGHAISEAPKVMPSDGSQFVGWYLEGDPTMRLINVENLSVYKNITLTAAYE